MSLNKDSSDKIDAIRQQWREECPSLDADPVLVLGRVYRIAHLASRPIEAVFRSHGLDRGEFDVLATLKRTGQPYELTPSAICEHLLVSSGGLTDRLIRLEKARLVTRTRSLGDGRSSVVKLTALGEKRVVAAYQDDMKLERQLMRAMSKREAKILGGLLRKLHISIECQTDASNGVAGNADRRCGSLRYPR
jgi:DNA-binding MarR family transcriptional regulator